MLHSSTDGAAGEKHLVTPPKAHLLLFLLCFVIFFLFSIIS